LTVNVQLLRKLNVGLLSAKSVVMQSHRAPVSQKSERRARHVLLSNIILNMQLSLHQNICLFIMELVQAAQNGGKWLFLSFYILNLKLGFSTILCCL